MGLHRCTDAACPHVGQRTDRSCRCHKTDEQVLTEQRDELLGLLNWLEQQVRDSRTGISFDWIPSVEGEPSGFRFMRRHFIGEPAKTLRTAIAKARAEREQSSAEPEALPELCDRLVASGFGREA